MVQVLGEFERLILPHLAPGHDSEVDDFKGVVRRKINRLAYEGKRAGEAQPGEALSSTAADLAETLAFDDDTED